MKTLYLLRHAKSSWKDSSLDDFDRPLSSRGRRAAPHMAAYMRQAEWVPDAVLCSAAQRARETWERMEALHEMNIPTEIDERVYMATPAKLLELVRKIDDQHDSLLLIGHNPGIERFAALLCADGEQKAIKRMEAKYPTAGLAMINLAADSWAEVEENSGYLERFIRPEDLENLTPNEENA